MEETEMLSKKDESRSINNLRKSIAAVLEEKNSLEAIAERRNLFRLAGKI